MGPHHGTCRNRLHQKSSSQSCCGKNTSTSPPKKKKQEEWKKMETPPPDECWKQWSFLTIWPPFLSCFPRWPPHPRCEVFAGGDGASAFLLNPKKKNNWLQCCFCWKWWDSFLALFHRKKRYSRVYFECILYISPYRSTKTSTKTTLLPLTRTKHFESPENIARFSGLTTRP